MFWQRFFSDSTKKRSTARRKSRPLSFDVLEERLAPVVGNNFQLPAIAPATTPYDGVVSITVPNPDGGAPLQTGTGALMSDGLHVLTAAHLLVGQQLQQGPVQQTVNFQLARTTGASGQPLANPEVETISINVPTGPGLQTSDIDFNPYDMANDIGMLTLPDQVAPLANREMVAPYYGEAPGQLGYEVNNVGLTVPNQETTMVGYGLTGTAATGAVPGTLGVKREGVNTFDGTTADTNISVESVGLLGNPSGGTFVLSYAPVGGLAVYWDIPIGSTALQVQNLISGPPSGATVQGTTLPNDYTNPLTGNVAVVGGPGGPTLPSDSTTYWIAFNNALANTPFSNGFLNGQFLPNPSIPAPAPGQATFPGLQIFDATGLFAQQNVQPLQPAPVPPGTPVLAPAVRPSQMVWMAGNATQRVQLDPSGLAPSGGYFQLSYTIPATGQVLTADIPYNAPANGGANSVQTLLSNLSTGPMGTGLQPLQGNVQVTQGPDGAGDYLITFVNDLADQPIAPLGSSSNGMDPAGNDDPLVYPFQDFTPTVTVTQAFPGIGFGPGNGGLLLDFDNGTPRGDALGILFGLSQTGVTPVNEQQTITLTGTPVANYTLTFYPTASAAVPSPLPVSVTVPWNATAQAIQNALQNASNAQAVAMNALAATPLLNNVSVTGPVGGPFNVTFNNGLAGTDVYQLQSSTPNVVVATVQNGQSENINASGDSGGPLFVNATQDASGLITGITASGATSFQGVGAIQRATNVSNYINSFITPALSGDYNESLNGQFNLVLDMNYQMLGVDGEPDLITITASNVGGQLELVVTDPDSPQYSGTYWSGLASNLDSLTIRTSNLGNTTVQIIGNLGLNTTGTTNDVPNGGITVNLNGIGNTVIIGADGGGNLTDISNVTVTSSADSDNDLIINDLGATAGRTYTFARNDQLTWTGGAIQFQNLSTVTLNAGNGTNIINVGRLNFTQNLIVQGGSGFNTFNVTDTVSTTTLNGGLKGDVFNLQAVEADTTLTVNSLAAGDIVNVGSTNGDDSTLGDIRGQININGSEHVGDGDGTLFLNINDDGAAGQDTYQVTTSTVNWNNRSNPINFVGVALLTINGAIEDIPPALMWSDPPNITYGTPLTDSQLDATANVPGSFTYTLADGITSASGAILNAGNQQLNVTFAPEDSSGYSLATAQIAIDVVQATPTITWNNPADITYGTALSGTQLDATANVSGNYTYTLADGVTPAKGATLDAGADQVLMATFTPTDSTDYATVTSYVTINVDQITPTITWNNPSAIAYGTPLTITQLDATASVGGSFSYTLADGVTPASGAVLNAGANQTLEVTFTPNDLTDYSPATASVTINVNQAAPSISWQNPAPILVGAALNGTQLDATANVAGTFTYTLADGVTQANGAVLGLGLNQTLNVTFTPTDSTDYSTATDSVTINVEPLTPAAPPILATVVGHSDADWPGEGELPTPGDTVLYFVLTGQDIDVVPAGCTLLEQVGALSMYETTNASDNDEFYNSVTGPLDGTRIIGVEFPAGTMVDQISTDSMIDETPSTGTTGTTQAANETALAMFGIGGAANPTNGYSSIPVVPGQTNPSPLWGFFNTLSTIGTTSCSVANPGDPNNYGGCESILVTLCAAGAEGPTLARPTITWNNPSAISYGTALSGTQLDATANVPGTFTYTLADGSTPALGALLGAGADQTLEATFTPTDTTDYATVTSTVTINVNKATPTLTVSGNSIDFTGSPDPATALIAGLNGVPGSSLEGVSPVLTYFAGSQSCHDAEFSLAA